MRALIAGAVLAGTLVLSPAPAAAHDAGSTLITVSTGRHDVGLTAQIPLSRIDFAYHTDLSGDPERSVPAARDWIAAMVSERVTLTASGGSAWNVTVGSVTADHVEAFDTARVELVATPPPGVRPGPSDLRWMMISDVVYTHKVFVGASDHGAVQVTGLMTRKQPIVRLAVTEAVEPAGFGTMLRAGFDHFREGADHLLFLCLVALAAFRRRDPPAVTLRRVALLTAMFTAGHSLSLACATLGWIIAPSRWVETTIAVTIGITALHAMRPAALPKPAELGVTGTFGLIHGFGFAGLLRELDLSGTGIAGPLLGFNVGLEAAQLLALVLLCVPLWILARSDAATTMLAAAAAMIALSWILERALNFNNILEPVARLLLGTPERLAIALLTVAAIVLAVNGARARAGKRPTSSSFQRS